ncbi:MAG: GtrA family protein [Muribaculaceae bacterium]|nr:GtrA family protein [Muribaculaceae bacterium]
MNEKVKKFGSDILNSNDLVFTFIRSAGVAQAASWVDLGTGFVLFAFAHFTPWVSTAIGAFAGGVINCILNYRFTFHAQTCPWKAVVVKYFLVWIGSLLLNSFGTQFLYYGLMHWPWLETLGFKKDGYFAAARLIVSGIVSLGWNFLLQKNFVYQNRKFDKYALEFLNLFSKKKHHNSQEINLEISSQSMETEKVE